MSRSYVILIKTAWKNFVVFGAEPQKNRKISLYVETETQGTFQFSRGNRILRCQRHFICKGFSTPQSLEWALLRMANLKCCLNPAETEQAKLSDAEPLVVMLPEWLTADTLFGGIYLHRTDIFCIRESNLSFQNSICKFIAFLCVQELFMSHLILWLSLISIEKVILQ